MSVSKPARDRDEAGRPRNTRPRDALGRPLPPGSAGTPRIPDDLFLPAVETLSYTQDLLDSGLAFNAHEVFEAAWKNGADAERPLWRSLAQFTVGITHIQRGNNPGAVALLQRAAAGLEQIDRPAPHAVDVDGLIDCATALIEDLTVGGEIDSARLRPRFVAAC
jgi:uncharacterized protein